MSLNKLDHVSDSDAGSGNMTLIDFGLYLPIYRTDEPAGDICEEADRITARTVTAYVFDIIVDHSVMMITGY